MEIVKELKGGSLSKTLVIAKERNLFVRKLISRKHNREYGLVRWQSQIRKLQVLNKFLPNSISSILAICTFEDYYFYDMPYYSNSSNCSEALLHGELPELIAEKIIILLNKMVKINFGIARGSLAVYVSEELLTPLLLASEASKSYSFPLNSQEKSFFMAAVEDAIPKVKMLLDLVANLEVMESLTHGNLTLENILWDKNSEELIMIDPYAETYCECIIGDVSQLFQSSLSGYEFISSLFEKQTYSICEYPLHLIPASHTHFARSLSDLLDREEWFSRINLDIFRASQFIRMFPFKLVSSPRQGAAFMIHGINLLNQI